MAFDLPSHGSQSGAGIPIPGSPLIIGHRGAAGIRPENTLSSFEKAVELNVGAVELDVHLCEGELVVIHDTTLQRTTNGTGNVSDQTLANLRQLDAGDGQWIPTLAEVFTAVPEIVGINVELKGEGTAAHLAQFLTGLPENRRDVLVSSFNHGLLREFATARPGVKTAPLFSKWREDAVKTAESFGGFINLSSRIVNRKRCDELCRSGLAVSVYTVNELALGRKLASWGVSGIFTDYPDRITRDALAR